MGEQKKKNTEKMFRGVRAVRYVASKGHAWNASRPTFVIMSDAATKKIDIKAPPTIDESGINWEKVMDYCKGEGLQQYVEGLKTEGVDLSVKEQASGSIDY